MQSWKCFSWINLERICIQQCFAQNEVNVIIWEKKLKYHTLTWNLQIITNNHEYTCITIISLHFVIYWIYLKIIIMLTKIFHSVIKVGTEVKSETSQLFEVMGSQKQHWSRYYCFIGWKWGMGFFLLLIGFHYIRGFILLFCFKIQPEIKTITNLHFFSISQLILKHNFYKDVFNVH